MKLNNSRSLILAGAMFGAFAVHSFAGVFVGIAIAPPPLRVEVQPVCPGDDYIWTPGHWEYRPGGYFWVPGAWVAAPQPGYLFTPGYWAFADGLYGWHPGHWGFTVGYYGGENYGIGYTGFGFYGGHWDHGHFFYNRAYANIDERRVHRFYHEAGHDRRDFRDRDRRRDERDHRREARERERDRHDDRGRRDDHRAGRAERVAHSGGSRSGHRRA